MTETAHGATAGAIAPASSYRWIGIGLALVGVIAFSVRPILVKLAYVYAPDPVTLLALRMIFALPFFLGVAAWLARRGRGAPIAGRDWLLVAGLGCVGYYLASFLDFLGLQYVSAGLGRLLLFAYPTVVVLLSAIFLGKKVRGREALALVVTYAGVALVVSNLVHGPSANLPLGAGLVFASAVVFAIYLVGSSQLVLRVGSLRFTAYGMIVASLCCIAQFLLLRPLSALALPVPVYGLAIAMAIGSTVIPVFMMSEALRRIGANHVALLGALGPVSTILLGYLGLDEMMTGWQIIGAVLVVAGVLLVSLRPAAKPV